MSSFELAAASFVAGIGCGAALTACLAFSRERRLGRFLSFAAHEINTPLTAVNMTVLNFISGALGPVDKSQEPWLKMLREQSERLAAIMGDMRDFIHLKLRGGMSSQVEEMDLAPVLEAAASSVSWGFSQAGIGIRTELNPSLPKIKADPDRLQRMTLDILYHCRKFRSSGDIDISARAAAGRVEVRFVYSGAHALSGEIRQALDAFYPARVRKDQLLTATGLGLGVLKLFLNEQGGDLSFLTDPDGRFAVVIVLAAATGGN